MAELCTNLRLKSLDKHLLSNGTPGPGTHDTAAALETTRTRSPSYSFGTGPRSPNRQANQAGGSGGDEAASPHLLSTSRSFNSLHPSSPNVVFGTGTRIDLQKIREGAGPGAYDVATALDSVRVGAPSFSIGNAARLGSATSARDGPGPSAYGVTAGAIGRQTLSTMPTSSRVPFGTAGRALSASHLQGLPGPGHYAVGAIDALGADPATSARPRSASTRIGTAPRFPSGGGGPGVPGPAYHPGVDGDAALRDRSPSFGFGTARRDVGGEDLPPRARSASADIGGGGATARSASGRGGTSAQASGRPGTAHTALTFASSGTGFETVVSTATRAPSTKFALTARFLADRGRVHTPAPDAYGGLPAGVTSNRPTSARHTIGTARRDMHRVADTPAPGAYGTISDALDAVRPRSARARFGTTPRFQAAEASASKNVTPGPALEAHTNAVRLLLRSPSAHFGTAARDGAGSANTSRSRLGASASSNTLGLSASPGRAGALLGAGASGAGALPGEHLPAALQFEATLPRSPRARIGTAPRFRAQSPDKASPGPSEYGVVTKVMPSSPAFTMRAR